MVVYRGIFLDKGIRGRHIGFRLVVVVVGDEILYGVIREKRLEFAIQLGSQGLVRRHHDGRALLLFHHIGHGEGFARPGHAKQRLVSKPRFQATNQPFNSSRLVASGLKF